MQNIIVDRDPNINYETNGILRTIFNFFFIPFLNALPAGMRNIVKKTNPSARDLIETATSHHAIEILYKSGEIHRSRNLFQQFFHYVWFSTNNPKAVRNRLRLVERELIKAIRDAIAQGNNISILSVASGSARAIVESINKQEFLNSNLTICFIDKSYKALEYSKTLVASELFPRNFTFKWIEDLAKNFQKHYTNKTLPNIIETVGLMDYFDDKKVLEFFTHVYTHLKPNGVFITANVADNPERKFVTNLVGWEMVYRQPEEFLKFAVRAGFKKENVRILIEPLGIHFVMVAKK